MLLDVTDLNAHYGRAHILHDLSFAVGLGQVLVLLGRNGAGKSTTMKTLIGLVRATGGQIRFDDQLLTHRAPHDIARAGIGYVPEERRIFGDLTVLENLDVGRQPPRPNLPVWTIEALFALFPNLATMRNRLGARMSGGEQQMLTIARTLMGNPRLVLLDEPSEGLSPLIVEQMAGAIKTLKQQGLTILLAEQNLHFAAQVADQAVVIEKGRNVWSGTMAALQADTDAHARYLAM